MSKRLKGIALMLVLCLLCGNVSFAEEPAQIDSKDNSNVQNENTIQNEGENSVESGNNIVPGTDNANSANMSDSQKTNGSIVPEENKVDDSIATYADTAAAPIIKSIISKNVDTNQGTFQVELSGIENENLIRTIQVPVWSSEGDQDDIVWYIANKNPDGNYYVDVDIKNHKYSTGMYQAHVYITSTSGELFFAGKTEANLPVQNGTMDITEISPLKYQIKNSGTILPGGLRELQFAVWSDVNGQDDLRWYSSADNGVGEYSLDLNIKNHRGLGRYKVHAYAITKSGQYICVGRSDFVTQESKINKVEIAEENIEKGIFQVKITCDNDTLLSNILVPVWSVENGQDDIVWYTAKHSKENEYTVDVNIKNHKYSTGTYNVHVYATDVGGTEYFAGSVTEDMKVEPGTLSLEKGDDDLNYKVQVEGVLIPAGCKEVRFATWSDVNGQDDIRWYSAQKKGDGLYKYDIKISNHKGMGKYNVHAYAVTKSGQFLFLGKKDFTIKESKIETIEVLDENQKDGTFQVKITCEDESVLRSILVPVWSKENGQDDIIWYKAIHSQQNEYIVNVDIKNHKYSTGEYSIHVYPTDITGFQYYAGMETADMAVQKGTLEIEKETESQYNLKMSNVQIPAGCSKVLFAVWSEVNGQNDIRWYEANGRESTFDFQMSLQNHKGLGKYNVHAYARLKSGAMLFLASDTFITKTPVIGNVEVTESDKKAGTFKVVISGIENADLIKEIQVPTWSDNGQKDIVWYTAKRNLSGDYVVDINIKQHQYNCQLYTSHVYLTDITGERYYVGKASCDMKPEYSGLNAEDSLGTETTYTINLQGLNVPAGESAVQFAVWGVDKGQNDIVWYTAINKGNGNYVANVKIRNHRELGDYNVHAYITTKSGTRNFVGTTGFAVKHTALASNIAVSEVNGHTGTFRVTVSGVMGLSGIEKVLIPIWSTSNQSNIKWYEASKISDGVYTTVMRVSNHGYNFGTYQIHVYATMGNGIQNGVGTTSQLLQADNYVYAEPISATQERIWLVGTAANRVQFPTWSDAYGQDDIVWYEGTNTGNGRWTAVVDSNNHASGGTYTTHAYATVNGVRNAVGSTGGYSLQYVPSEVRAMWSRANMYSSSTPYIIMVDCNTHRVGIFQGWQGNWTCIQHWACADGKASTPTVRGVFSVGSRGYYFDSGAYRCHWWTQFYNDYLFHSVLYNKNGTVADGRVGVGLSHGCVRLEIQNAKWIYDNIPSGTRVVVY